MEAGSSGVGEKLGAGSRGDGDYYKIGRRGLGGVTSRLAVEGLGK